MKTIRNIMHMIIISSVIACSKDDGPKTTSIDPVQQPDPKPENRAPASFALLAPETDGKDISRRPAFSWEQATDPDGDVVTYDLYLGTEGVPETLVAQNLGTTSLELSENLNLNTEYHWKVVAKDNKEAATESAIGTFTTDLPIVFLREFKKILPEAKLNELRTSFLYFDNEMWAFNIFFTLFDPSSGKLKELQQDLSNKKYIYTYTATGKQKTIELLGSSVSNRLWTMEYDAQDRPISIVLATEDAEFMSVDKTTFSYLDSQSTKPIQIEKIRTANFLQGPEETKFTLEWEGDNIVSIIGEGMEENGTAFYGREEYSYDNNINPYSIITEYQFGWDSFFACNETTEMETLNFGPFFWQSLNNITKIERFDTADASEPFETEVYDYTYTEDYYPMTANALTTNINGISFSTELNWSY